MKKLPSLLSNHRMPIGIHLGETHAYCAQLEPTGNSFRLGARVDGEIPANGDRASALQRLVSRGNFRGRRAVVSLSPADLILQSVKLPQMPPDEVAGALAFEAEERLPIPAENVDLRHLLAGSSRQDGADRQEVILMAVEKKKSTALAQLVCDAGLEPVAIEPQPLAELRAIAIDSPRQRRAVLQFGRESSTVLCAEGARVVLLKTIPVGWAGVDLAIGEQFELDPLAAGRLRRKLFATTDLDPEDDLHRKMITAIRPTLEKLADEIEMCLRYVKVAFRLAETEQLDVCGDEVPVWIAEYLYSRLGIECRCADPLSTIEAAEESGSPWQWTAAIGLSLHGVSLG